jgi:cytochrome c biogenesis protein CcmG, thiol:disulfide interchange protein DsbE
VPRWAWVLVAAGCVAAFVAVEALSGTQAATARAAPPLPRQVLEPPATTIAALRGRPAIVHFWASWCGPCQKEAGELARLSARLRGRAALVGVDYTDAAGSARRFIARHGWRFPNLADPDGHAGDAYGLGGLPTTFLVDADGRIVRRLTGPQTAAGLLRAVARLERARS